MEKMKLHSPDFIQDNIAKLAELFPNCVTETLDADGKPLKAIDFDQLRQELSANIVEGPQERYQLNWPGKREALLTANAPIAKTLRPCREESVDFDTTQNLYIEGDNLDALKLLQETYLGKVKMIYIDPPYNTGNDFIYQDDFAEDSESYKLRSNQKDEAGNRLVANTESNGRFHSDWLSMMYPRLKLARNLLKDGGCICVSIDDNEQATLKILMDEIFGSSNFITNIIWRSSDSSNNDSKQFSIDYNHTLLYSKSLGWESTRLERTEENNEHYKNPDNDPNGPWFSGNLSSPNPRVNLTFDIISPNGTIIKPPKNGWRWKKERIDEMIESQEIIFSEDQARIIKKTYLKDQLGVVSSNIWWDIDDTGHNRNAKYELIKIFSELKTSDIFKTPKPTKFIKKLLKICSDKNDIILDFFSGSATTAHAVMQINSEDCGNRKFFMVQLPEIADEASEAFKLGYTTISEIGKERLRRAGQKIKAESQLNTVELDIGFRVLKVDSSNMNDVYYSPDVLDKANLASYVSNIRADRSDEDLFFQVLLDWGLDLTLPIQQQPIDGKSVFIVAENAIAACFDREGGITEAFIKQLAEIKPLRAVFCDAGFANDSVKINVEQIFKLLSPNTELKTL